MRRTAFPTLLAATFIAGCSSRQAESGPPADVTDMVRAELEWLYVENAAAFMRSDLEGVMALRSADFHSVTPDGQTHDRAAMEQYIRGFIDGIREWHSLSFAIDSLHVSGDTAYAIVVQHADRRALRSDNQVHHVETWVTQREIWVRQGGRWLMWRVDDLRDQRRLVDGQPG